MHQPNVATMTTGYALSEQTFWTWWESENQKKLINAKSTIKSVPRFSPCSLKMFLKAYFNLMAEKNLSQK